MHKATRRLSLATLGLLVAGVGMTTLGLSATASAEDADMAKAKAEGKVVWYTSTPIEQANKLARLFETETGIKVELFRSGGSAILRRFNQEQSAGQIAADVLTTSDPAASNVMTRPAPDELASRCSIRSAVQRTGRPACFDARAISTT